MKDITYCCANECPSKECQIKVTNNHFEAGDIISMADFAGVCKFYISWVVSKMDKMRNATKEEQEAVAEYYKSIGIKTGINALDLAKMDEVEE